MKYFLYNFIPSIFYICVCQYQRASIALKRCIFCEFKFLLLNFFVKSNVRWKVWSKRHFTPVQLQIIQNFTYFLLFWILSLKSSALGWLKVTSIITEAKNHYLFTHSQTHTHTGNAKIRQSGSSLKNKVTILPSSSTVWYIPKKNEHVCPNKNLYTNAHNNIIH